MQKNKKCQNKALCDTQFSLQTELIEVISHIQDKFKTVSQSINFYMKIFNNL